MDYIALADHTARQIIDATTVFDEFWRVEAQARTCTGGMYWKRQDEREYLVRTLARGRQHRLGLRSPETEKIHAEFSSRKAGIEARLAALRTQLRVAERLNKALRAGRLPTLVVAVLQCIEDAGLGAHFTVVGTHALYAYEAAAGVRIVAGALATQDVDLLWDARRRVRFESDIGKLDTSMLRVLQKADPTFRRKAMQAETAINDKGFEVDFLRRQPIDGDPHPFRFSADEDDLWPAQAIPAGVLTSAPRFEHIVIAATGRMTVMRTVAPQFFVDFKRWMAAEALGRPAAKRQRDRRQADIVAALLADGLLLPQAGVR